MPATSAKLSFPVAVAPLSTGGYLIADQADQLIRWSAPDGNIYNFGGTGIAGFSGDGGPVANARFNNPADVAQMPGGGYVVADAGNCRIRYVSSSGIVNTIAGSGTNCNGEYRPLPTNITSPPLQVDLSYIGYMSVTAWGGIVFADQYANRIMYLDAARKKLRVIGGAGGDSGWNGDGSPLSTKLALPDAVAVTGYGTLFTDTGNNRVRIIDGEPAGDLYPPAFSARSTVLRTSRSKQTTRRVRATLKRMKLELK